MGGGRDALEFVYFYQPDGVVLLYSFEFLFFFFFFCFFFCFLCGIGIGLYVNLFYKRGIIPGGRGMETRLWFGG